MARIAQTFILILIGTFQASSSLPAHPRLSVGSLKIQRSSADSSTRDNETATGNPCCPSSTDTPRSVEHLFSDLGENESSLITTQDYSHLSEEFVSCRHFSLEREFYEERADGTVYVPGYKKTFPRSDHLVRNHTLYVCPDFISKFPDHVAIISVVGSSISTACLVLHVLFYVSVKTVKNLQSRCLLSLCIALLLAYVFTYVQQAANDHESCRVVGMSMVYFFLAAFFWMNVFSYEVWRSIRLATTQLRTTRDRPTTSRFIGYSVYAWGSPLLISILSIVVHNSTSNVKFQLVFDTSICWFRYKEALSLYFAGPLFALLGINILLTASSFVMISTASMRGDCGKESFDLRARLCLSLRLSSSMGLMWVSGVIAVATMQEWLWYLFAVCSALQGLFIFLTFTLNESSRKELVRALQKLKFSTTSVQPSSHSATDV